MQKLKRFLCSSLLLVVSVPPALAGAKDATDTKAPTETTGNPAAQPAAAANPNLVPVAGNANVTALLGILVMKGVLAPSEANAIRNAAPDAELQLLLDALARKGVVSAADMSPAVEANPALSPAAPVRSAMVETPQTSAPTAKPPAPKVIPAVAPIRSLQLEPSPVDGMIPDIKLGSSAKVKVYGMVKASSIYDSSSPYGTDMPLPGFINTTTAVGVTPFDPGPNGAPEFHVKARFFRVGTNFEWPDASKNNSITGKFEFDFEGNYTRALNRNISTIRSSTASIRLAYGRIDHRFNDDTSIFALFGQDWTPFGSSSLPALYETTGLGLGFGTLYERAPQFRFGVGHKIGGSRNVFFQPEFAVVMPAFGNDPKAIDNQLGYGERQGADSAQPEIQSRIVTQWQLDKAPGVVPAQLIFSGVHGERTALVRAADIPLCPVTTAGCPADAKVFQEAFPTGTQVSSQRWGYTVELQLPTRWATLTTKYWRGGDLRWYFVGSLLSNFNDKGVFETGSPVVESFSNDQSSTVLFGLRNGVATVAPQRPVRAQGGWVNLGLPLGRIFRAEPAGRNAGWVLYMYYAFDDTFASDVRKIGNTRQKNDLAAATLNWKMNNMLSFAFEESYYRTRVVGDPTGVTPLPIYRGVPSRQWQDIRTEIGPIFTF
jgi:hypothetical protein